jgi:hypothetical protein
MTTFETCAIVLTFCVIVTSRERNGSVESRVKTLIQEENASLHVCMLCCVAGRLSRATMGRTA